MSGVAGELDLITRARAGDSDAFAALCERSRSRLWRVVASVSRGAEAEDLAQDAIVRAWASLHTYRADAPFDAWLCRIALNAAHDFRRSAWRRRVLVMPWSHDPDEAVLASGQADLDDEVARREMVRRVRQAVAGLPEKQRVPIWLHYFEEFALAEIARLEGKPESTIRSRIQSGLRSLQKSLPPMPDLLPAGEPWSEPEVERCGA